MAVTRGHPDHLNEPLDTLMRVYGELAVAVTKDMRPDERRLLLTTAASCNLMALVDNGIWPAPPEEMSREELLYGALIAIGFGVSPSQFTPEQRERAILYARTVADLVFNPDTAPIWSQ